MSVPSHNLYDFIHQVTERQFLLFYFYPWGEKDYQHLYFYQKNRDQIDGIDGLKTIVAKRFVPEDLLDHESIMNFQPVLLCHDQEPLNFDFYQDDGLYMKNFFQDKISGLGYPVSQQNLRSCLPWNWYEKWILLHTEKNSSELKKYEDTGRYQGAFWWSHAFIARDWYRFAQFDKSFNCDVKHKKLFLIYSRASSGTRNYRKKIIDSIKPIMRHCQIGSKEQFEIAPESSAIYDRQDFAQTEISVVLETLFEDDRIYLTEKTLRPIACGHPFILAGGAGSLGFLKSYGFETFHPWIDESYDHEMDHDRRREMIIQEMFRIANLDESTQNTVFQNCKKIAERNKQLFFSDRFYNRLIDELQTNVDIAYRSTKDRFSHDFRWNILNWRKKNNLFVKKPIRAITTPLIRYCRQHNGSFEKYQSHQHRLDDESSTDGHDV